MKIQINTDNNIEAKQGMANYFEEVIAGSLNRFSEQITRVEVHLNDENGNKSGPDDKRCLLEARLEGMQPIAVSHQAESLDKAVNGATDKLKKAIDSALGKLRSY
ncbi:MAG TPA: HPF/RaiA family ribosome-associated protein [Flavisolibacter sp.]|nr:HPF/RaiA family ribosome-associated protein [Flavisolibacter sp.]